MLLPKYPRSIIKELKSLYSDFNNLVIKNNQDKQNQDLKLLKSKFKILELEPNISIMIILLLKNCFKTKNIEKFNKIFLITELYYIGFTLHLNVNNPKFSNNLKSQDTNTKTYQVLLGDYIFTKIFEILLSLKNNEILNIFAKYNKQISEGMLDIKSSGFETYGAFVKLCIESICILSPELKNSEILDMAPNLESIFSNINLNRNIYLYNLIEKPKDFEFQSSLNELKLNVPIFDYYIDSLIARI